MDIEILDKNPHNAGPPVQQKAFTLLFNEKPVRGYRLMVKKGDNFKVQTHNPFLIAGLTDASEAVSVNKKLFSKKGDFIFIPAGDSVQFTNNGRQPYSFAILELK